MSKRNMSILVQNILDQFGDDARAKQTFHVALDKFGDISRAERFAQEAHLVREFCSFALPVTGEILTNQKPQFAADMDKVNAEVLEFIMQRLWHYRLGQQAMGGS